MSVKIKKVEKDEEKVQKVGFSVADFMAIEGLKGSGFEGKTKSVHKVVGEKLISKKFAKEVKADLEKKENPHRATKDVPKDKK